MTTRDATRPAREGQRHIYGAQGRPIATITPMRSEWHGALLAECERGHIYVWPTDVRQWMTVETGCPRCRVLGHG
jgi:hypothetical protein